jgi:hypothetical protein
VGAPLVVPRGPPVLLGCVFVCVCVGVGGGGGKWRRESHSREWAHGGMGWGVGGEGRRVMVAV